MTPWCESLEGRRMLTGDLVMLRAIGGRVLDVAGDAAGNLYVAGAIARGDGGSDAFVARYNAAGKLAWLRRVGGAGANAAQGLVVMPNNGVVACGRFSGAADFDPSRRANVLRSRGGTDGFAWSLDAKGRSRWAWPMGGKGNDGAAGIARDGQGRVYVTGHFMRRAAAETLPPIRAKGTGAFVWVLKASPLLLAEVGLGAAGRVGEAPAGDGARQVGRAIAVDGDGSQAWIGGSYGAAENGESHAFLARVTVATRGVAWTGIGGEGADGASGVALDPEGRPVIVGQYTGAVDFDNDPESTVLGPATDGSSTAFIARYTRELGLSMVKSIAGAGADRAQDVAIDPAGAIYIAGDFEQTPDFDIGGGVYQMMSRGGADAFIAKITPAGRFVYARSFNGTGRDRAMSIGIAGGDVLVGGDFGGETTFGVGDLAQTLRSEATSGYALRLSQAEPSFNFARTFGDSGSKVLNAVVIDEADSLYLVGTFSGTLTFGSGPGQVQFTSAGGTDLFIGKFCNKCNITWGRVIGGPEDDQGLAIAFAEDGSVLATGSFRGTIDADPGEGVAEMTSAGGMDGVLVKLTSSGDFAWAQRLGGAGDDRPTALAVRGTSTYVGGTFQQEMVIGEDTLASAGGDDAFIAKFDGQSPAWAVRDGSAGEDALHDLALFDGGVYAAGASAGQIALSRIGEDGTVQWRREVPATGGGAAYGASAGADGGVVVVGGFSGLVDLGALGTESDGGEDAFLMEWSAGGELRRFGAFGGVGEDRAIAVAHDAFGNTSIGGEFEGSMDADPSAAVWPLTSAGATDILVAKFAGAGAIIWAGSAGGAGADQVMDVASGGAGAFAYLLGAFEGSADLDPTAESYVISASANPEAFLTRIVF